MGPGIRHPLPTAQDDRYRLVRDDSKFGVASSEEWVNANRLHPLAAKPAAAQPSSLVLPPPLEDLSRLYVMDTGDQRNRHARFSDSSTICRRSTFDRNRLVRPSST